MVITVIIFQKKIPSTTITAQTTTKTVHVSAKSSFHVVYKRRQPKSGIFFLYQKVFSLFHRSIVNMLISGLKTGFTIASVMCEKNLATRIIRDCVYSFPFKSTGF